MQNTYSVYACLETPVLLKHCLVKAPYWLEESAWAFMKESGLKAGELCFCYAFDWPGEVWMLGEVKGEVGMLPMNFFRVPRMGEEKRRRRRKLWSRLSPSCLPIACQTKRDFGSASLSVSTESGGGRCGGKERGNAEQAKVNVRIHRRRQRQSSKGKAGILDRFRNERLRTIRMGVILPVTFSGPRRPTRRTSLCPPSTPTQHATNC
ncbi:hypothetical protein BLNAU_13251 [Blattamonas nauphoetae]|uniref:SH3 domain-containing protein n=1 Tax=Blattamonas nauphoetae TaxID=2049346 RepID=A0ABQ9XH23_9EUKA|nr:hypothetical protein BLNAU_13251 [Blattamonas nauphoetae]